MQQWLEFWNRPHRIYVNARHRAAHYRCINRDLLALLPHRSIDLLDWGCGDALGAVELAQAGVRLTLFDKAPATHRELELRYATDARIRVLDEASYAILPGASFDVVFINSVLQYLSEAEFVRLLPELRRLLRPGGRLLLGDVIPPDARMTDDIGALLKSSWAHGYFVAALTGLVATFFSDYRNLRQRLGLTTYHASRMIALLTDAGFAARRLQSNIGFSDHRQTFEAAAPA